MASQCMSSITSHTDAITMHNLCLGTAPDRDEIVGLSSPPPIWAVHCWNIRASGRRHHSTPYVEEGPGCGFVLLREIAPFSKERQKESYTIV